MFYTGLSPTNVKSGYYILLFVNVFILPTPSELSRDLIFRMVSNILCSLFHSCHITTTVLGRLFFSIKFVHPLLSSPHEIELRIMVSEE